MPQKWSTNRGLLCRCSYTATSLILGLRPRCTGQAYYRVSPDNWLYFPHVPITHKVHVDCACGDSQAPERQEQAGLELRPHRHTATRRLSLLISKCQKKQEPRATQAARGRVRVIPPTLWLWIHCSKQQKSAVLDSGGFVQNTVQSWEPPAILDSQALWTGQVATTRRDVLNGREKSQNMLENIWYS